MLRITQNSSADGTNKYFFGYYSEQDLATPKWYGKGAEKLGLSGEIQDKEFEAICHNTNPETKEQLTARNAKDRTVGYDFTFSVPKSVSLVYALTQDKEIIEAFNNSIEKTMLEVEEHAETRVRKSGKYENRKTENLIWGTFTHGESRPVEGVPDPQLHQHAFVFNATYDEQEAKWKAGQFRNLKSNAPYFETLANSHLASELQKIGYEVERNKNDFELKGFERATIKKFSNRTKQIEAKAMELGITYAEDKAALGATTRASKLKELDRNQLQEEWKSRLSKKELDLVYNSKSTPPDGGDSKATEKTKEITVDKALDYSLAHNLERKSTVKEKEIYIHALKRSYGSVTPEALTKELESRKDLMLKTDQEGNKIFTTQKALDEEKALKNSAREGRGMLKPINEGYTIKNEKLSPEQANAVQHVLKSKDFITVVSGGAGTGKTWSIKEVAEGVNEKGVNFGAFAPSSAASRQVQRADGFKNATTIADLLQNEQLQKSVKDGVIWIDEAGMVGNKTMNSIIDIAKKQDARILLTGDIKQHNSVERGDALRIIQKYGGVKPARISKIQRQKVDSYKKAVEWVSSGKVKEGVKALDKMGAIKEATDFEQLKENVATEYVNAIKSKEDTLIVATTHAQGISVTNSIRDKLKAEKLVSKAEKTITIQKNLSFTEPQKQDVSNYQKGLSIQFHQNLKGGIKRGARYDVTGKDKEGNILISELGTSEKKNQTTLPLESANKFSVYEKQEISIAKGDKIRITQNGFSTNKQRVNNGNILSVKGFDDNGNIIASTGKRNITLSKEFGNLTHGYYTTSPASQGKSVNRVIVMQSSMSGKAASKEQFYVSASRGKFAISIHTDDKDNLLRSVTRSTQRMTATEIANDNQSSKVVHLKDRLKKMGSIYRAVKSKVANFKDSINKDQAIIKLNPKPQKQIAHAAPTKGK